MFIISVSYTFLKVAGQCAMHTVHCTLIASQYYITSLNNINNQEWLTQYIEVQMLYISVVNKTKLIFVIQYIMIPNPNWYFHILILNWYIKN